MSCNELYASQEQYQPETQRLSIKPSALQILAAFRANRANYRDIDERSVSGTLQKPGPSSTV